MQENDPSPSQLPPPTCIEKQPAEMLCCTLGCQQACFVCFQKKCRCYNVLHESCSEFLRASKVVKRIHEKKGVLSQELDKSLNAVIKIYDDAIEQLSSDREEVQQWKEMYGLSKDEAKFLKMMIECRACDITGDMANRVKGTVYIEPETSSITEERVQKFWDQRRVQFQSILADIKSIYKAKIVPLTSLITTETDQLERFLGSPVLNYKLLYRASEHNFSVSEFHQKCDGIRHTLLLVRTEFDRIIGGYTPVAWRSQIGYTSDPTGKSFVFSLSTAEKYPLLEMNKAIYCRDGYGPDFGEDICIRPEANQNRDSYCKFPSHYNNGAYTKGQSSIEAFCGSSSDQFIRIKEWEVFQIQWLSS